MYRYLSYILMPLSIILCHVCCMAQNFCIADTSGASTIFVDADDYTGVIRAARDLGDDVRKVTGTSAPVLLTIANTAISDLPSGLPNNLDRL